MSQAALRPVEGILLLASRPVRMQTIAAEGPHIASTLVQRAPAYVRPQLRVDLGFCPCLHLWGRLNLSPSQNRNPLLAPGERFETSLS